MKVGHEGFEARGMDSLPLPSRSPVAASMEKGSWTSKVPENNGPYTHTHIYTYVYVYIYMYMYIHMEYTHCFGLKSIMLGTLEVQAAASAGCKPTCIHRRILHL